MRNESNNFIMNQKFILSLNAIHKLPFKKDPVIIEANPNWL